MELEIAGLSRIDGLLDLLLLRSHCVAVAVVSPLVWWKPSLFFLVVY